MRYRVNTPHVIAETIGGETIIVHLSTGCYFNLGGTAVEIWDGIAAEQPTSSIVQQLVLRYDAQRRRSRPRPPSSSTSSVARS